MADTTRNIRVSDDLWSEATEQAERLGLNTSAYVRMALRRQVDQDRASQGVPSGQ